MLRGAALVCVVALIAASPVARAQDSRMPPSGAATVLAQRADQSGQGSDRPEKDSVGGQQSPGGRSSPVPMPGTRSGDGAAQKAVLYEEDPSDPTGKSFAGSTVWRTENVTTDPGQPPELAIRAEVEVPERRLAITWSLRRNADRSLPASHTAEIRFKLPADFPSGGVSRVAGILMKPTEQARGVPLAAVTVKVTNDVFQSRLSSGEADKERNLQILKDLGWIDIAMVYNNNRRALLLLEKGTPGERVFAEAFAAWSQQGARQ
jgi:hypothetical protein